MTFLILGIIVTAIGAFNMRIGVKENRKDDIIGASLMFVAGAALIIYGIISFFK